MNYQSFWVKPEYTDKSEWYNNKKQSQNKEIKYQIGKRWHRGLGSHLPTKREKFLPHFQNTHWYNSSYHNCISCWLIWLSKNLLTDYDFTWSDSGGRKRLSKKKNTSNCGSRFSSTGGRPVIISNKTYEEKKKSEEKHKQPLVYIPFEKRNIILSLPTKCSQDLYLSKDSPLCNWSLFLPLFPLSVISSVVWEVFPHPMLRCFKAKWKDSQDTQLHHLAYLPMKLNAMKEGVNGSSIYSEWIHFSPK